MAITSKAPAELKAIMSLLQGMDTDEGISILTYTLGAIIASTAKTKLSDEAVDKIVASIAGSIRLSYTIHSAIEGDEDNAVKRMMERAQQATAQQKKVTIQ